MTTDAEHDRGQPARRRWTLEDCRDWIAVPGVDDDKYSRGVLGMATGSDRYPGAAVLGAEAAARTGIGMIRYVGDDVPAGLILQRRPEVVTVAGRVQAWLLGSGTDAAHRDPAATDRLRSALAEGVPAVVDAGALDLLAVARGPVVVTPHYRELSRLLAEEGVSASASDIAADPAAWAVRAARAKGVVVLLKGHVTHVAAPSGEVLDVSTGPDAGWLATAGSGDVLGGILGALVATHADAVAEGGAEAMARLAATAAALHGAAAALASSRHGGGPIVALDVADAVSAVIGPIVDDGT
ncbi:NAD(P)H-hydrate dehydratase [Planctomonas sp. JC2975]|uniref:ADP-dependent NAD(P)H-hydrate dehydratase n=1 Tax=Planctomonas sp. JC2975 TaxID=2729626 RepID=UPI001474B969|nr:ADP/ATP-dependent (S)-NAD(P)H-hydrate dehydratase [Planctomonas sp. JC2975]NNC13138.1 NAD(P)H-hydrate dehydratase [Planctomonas sp. JC2975]